MPDTIHQLTETVRQAAAAKSALRPLGHGSKDFYGGPLAGEPLEVSAHSGIVEYEPSELVVTVRAGTSLDELETALRAQGQMLGFEPPRFGGKGTVGGAVASGLSGPRRACAGAVRDFILGSKIIDGTGEPLAFGGKVIKNVAGFDLSRLLAGSLGTLGVITEVSFKTLPLPAREETLRFEFGEADAIRTMNQWAGKPLPISATCWHAGQLHVRLSGAQRAIESALDKLGGERLADASSFWQQVRDHQHAFFAGPAPLWRVSLPSTAEPVFFGAEPLIEWNGALRWLRGTMNAEDVRAKAAALGGHATRFRGAERTAVFQPLPAPMQALHRRIKLSLDPHNILSPGRMDNF